MASIRSSSSIFVSKSFSTGKPEEETMHGSWAFLSSPCWRQAKASLRAHSSDLKK